MWITYVIAVCTALQRTNVSNTTTYYRNIFGAIERNYLLYTIQRNYNAMGRYKTSIKIPPDKLSLWAALRTEQDASAIAESIGVVRETIYNAFNNGECQPEVFDAMDTYYENKRNDLYELMGD